MGNFSFGVKILSILRSCDEEFYSKDALNTDNMKEIHTSIEASLTSLHLLVKEYTNKGKINQLFATDSFIAKYKKIEANFRKFEAKSKFSKQIQEKKQQNLRYSKQNSIIRSKIQEIRKNKPMNKSTCE